MEQLEKNLAEFNQVVIGALDQVFGALDSGRFLGEGVGGVERALGSYTRQVRRIKQAAAAAHMAGLQFVCTLIEQNLTTLQAQNRILTTEEYALLREWPELLARYALNQSDSKVDTLIRHLAATNWPAPLQAVDSDRLRRLLSQDSAEHALFMDDMDYTEHAEHAEPAEPAEPADGDGAAAMCANEKAFDPMLIHHAIDALITIASAENAFGVHTVADRASLACYAAQLEAVAACARTAGLGGLISACNAFSQVLDLRTLNDACMTDAESELLIHFPILAMDHIAAQGSEETAIILMNMVNNPIWHGTSVDAIGDDWPEMSNDAGPRAVPRPTLEEPEPGQQGEAELQQIGRDMLALLAKEFANMRDVLAEDLAAVVKPRISHEMRRHALGNYLDLLARLGATAESVGLSALNRMFSHLMQLVAASDVELSAAQLTLLTQLPQRIADYLADPVDHNGCAAVVDLLADSAWDRPLLPSAVEAWIAALAHIALVDDDAATEVRKTEANAADVSLTLPDDLNLELLEGLLQELPIQVANFTAAIARFVAGNGTMADVEKAKRAAHTLKGAANTVGVPGIANLTHHLEDLLIGVSNRNTLPARELADLLTGAADCLEAMSEAVMGTGPAPHNAQHLLQQVLDFANRSARVEEGVETDGSDVSRRGWPDRTESEDNTLGTDSRGISNSQNLPSDNRLGPAAEPVSEPPFESASETPATPDQMLRVPAPLVDELLRLAGENIISNSQIQERLRQTIWQSKVIQKQDTVFQKLIGELENLVDIRGIGAPHKAGNVAGEFDPLEFERYSELHTITSQLIEATADARQMSGQVDEQLSALSELLEVQRRLQMESQHAVIRTRLIPVSTVVSRFQRGVRQACRLLDKQVELTIAGESTSIDSNMLHDLIDPLMHVLRNAVDHGIEAAAIRIAAGKAAQGRIELSFAREGNSIVVRCRDDGAGLDYAAIRRIALLKNLISPERTHSDDEMNRLILMAGFSTRDTSSAISGRGIGMDAVHSSILEMKGSLTLRSSAGLGLTVELRLPATLLSEHTLMTRVGDKLLAVSSRRIIDIHYITREQIEHIGSQQVYRVGDAVHNLIELETLLALPANPNAAAQLGFPVLLIGTDSGATCAILVQELVDGREVVVKKFGRYVPKIQGTIGAVILGDGSVAPVIDLPELLRAAAPQRRSESGEQADAMTPAVQASPVVARTALVVDDSISARRATAQIMKDAGYEVRTAIDGLDAVALLEELVPDIILVDMEMPRMNGLELTTHVRARQQTSQVPVIMITSRSTEKHRQQGDAAGVNAYLTKPFSDDVLLQHVNRLVLART